MTSDSAPALTKQILSIPAEERSCRTLLVDGKLRPSSLWRWSSLNWTRRLYPRVKDFVSYVWIRRSFEILGYNRIFLPRVSDVERRFTVTSMSNAKINLLDHAGAMKRYKDELTKKWAAMEGKKSEANKSKEGPAAVLEHVYISSPECHQKRKRPRKESAKDRGKSTDTGPRDQSDDVFKPDSSMTLLALGISSFNDPAGFLSWSEEFLLSADEAHLKKQRTEEVFNTTTLTLFQVDLPTSNFIILVPFGICRCHDSLNSTIVCRLCRGICIFMIGIS